jgi:hypothetical protein
VAERERLTNKERRAQAREERKRQEAEAAQKKKRGQLRNGLITVAIVLVVGAVLLQAFTGGPDTDLEVELVSTEVEDARAAAGCEMIAEGEPLEDRSHVESSDQVDPNTSYTATRPTHSGPHTVGVHPITAGASSQIDEIASTHNLEHGSIIAWWDPDQVDGAVSSDMGDWAETLNANGFRRDQAGVGIMTAPYEDPGIESGKAIAFRAWGTAMDCDEWDEDVAHAFVLDHFGTHGIGPERTLAPFPDGVITSDVDVGDTTEEEAPTDQPDFEGIEPGETDEDEIEDAEDVDDADEVDDGDDAGDDAEDTDDEG